MTKSPSVDVPNLASAFASSRLIDLTPVIRPHMPRWPTHPDVEILRGARTHEEHGYFAQTLVLPEHSGCHVDAPAHLVADGSGMSIDNFTLDALIGPAKKFDLSGEDLQPGEVLSLARFEVLAAKQGMPVAGDIVLFQFGWDEHFDREIAGEPGHQGWWGANAPGLDDDVCRTLHEIGIRAVGSDTAGCDIAVRDGQIVSSPGHHTWFLPKGTPVVEGLYNLAAAPEAFFFMALPLKIDAGSGSPLRAVALVPR